MIVKDSKPTLLYVADPMCPWCWGFSSIFNEIRDRFEPIMNFRYVAGGLRTGDRVAAVNEETIEYVKDHWECAMLESGQPFNLDYVDRMDFAYNTEPGCRAVVTVRNVYPGREFEFEKKLQASFYSGESNPTRTETFLSILKQMELPSAPFESAFLSPAIDQELREDFHFASIMDRRILPSLFLMDGEKPHPVCSGFTTRTRVLERIHRILDHEEFSLEESGNGAVKSCDMAGEDCC